MMIGRNALSYDDYALSIQYFSQVISAKPYLYEPYFFRGLAKFYLEDYTGAETDCTKSINLNPYYVNSYEVRKPSASTTATAPSGTTWCCATWKSTVSKEPIRHW